MARIPPQSPPRIIPDREIVPTMKNVILDITSVIDDIVAEISPETACFNNTVEPYIAVNNSYQGEIGVIFMLQYAAPAAETQSIVSDAIRLWSEAQSSLIARQDYFLLLQAVKDRNESLGTESQLLLDDLLLDCQECGLGQMTPQQVQQHLRNSEEIEQLAMEFRQNMAHDSNGVWFTEKELDGVPSDEISRWSTETDGPNIGRKFVPFSNGGTVAVLTHAKSPDVRERMFMADHRNLEPNDRLLQAIIMKRQTQAANLGYESHAAFRAQRRLLKSPQVIRDFLNSLKQDLIALGKVEVDLLRRQQEPCSSAPASKGRSNAFPAWDQACCSKRAEKERDIDHAHISEYFPLDHTAEAMLTVFESLLGLKFLDMSQSDLGSQYFWHHTVRAFSVWEQGQEEFVGYLFFDLLWRENKYRGNQNVTHECGYAKPDGTRRYPSTILMCCFPTKSAERPVLLKHSQVVTLFHELGHGIHNLVSKTKYACFHGTNLPPDFGEIPSMLLENLCWRQDVLEQLSYHYTGLDSRYAQDWRQRNIGADVLPDCKIPSRLVDALARNSYAAMIELVKSQDEAESLNLGDKFYRLREEYESLDFGDLKQTGHWHGSIPHYVGGYDVGYYSYLVCTAFAQDIYESVFQDNPWDRSKWQKLRREVLQYGGSHPNMMGMLRDFLGRPPSKEVFIETLKRAIVEDGARKGSCK
ncbi:metallopeptidase [Fusarium mundagurra]|uniref:Metallopeptidase n=1 Tax=Fusarium mundagurra TaxID=1567541 RepID=A0A8H5Y7X8_9HYPO|nr:metallopeptidase [Fusarium mundagurra]